MISDIYIVFIHLLIAMIDTYIKFASSALL